MDGIKILRFILPESDLDQWVWMSFFQSLFWFEFKNVFDLFGPHDHATLEDMSLILFRDVVSGSQLLRWGWELGLTVDLAHGDKGLS